MSQDEFEQLVAEEFPKAVPEKFHSVITNVAFLIEDEPSEEVRRIEGLGPEETLLGYYKGVPVTARGDGYGMGGTLPDTITLYQLPIEKVAAEEGVEVRTVIRETIWHEVAHYMGMDEDVVRNREAKRDSI